MFPNKYPGNCNNPACKIRVNATEGYTQKINGRFVVWCKQCIAKQPAATALTGQSKTNHSQSTERLLTVDFRIITPSFEEANYPLIKSLPGARWDGINRYWTVSQSMADRPRILEIADRIGLNVHPSLREIQVTEQAQKAISLGLYPFQVQGVNFLSHKDKALLGDDMGLGKTVQSLMAIPENGAALVVCPAGLKYNWLDEVKKWRSDLTPMVLSGRGNFMWPDNGEVVIINHDILPVEFQTISRNPNEVLSNYWERLKVWRKKLQDDNPKALKTVLIVDEAHLFKNHESNRSRKMKEICRLTGKLIGLTGSPLTNRPDDLYGVFDVLGLAKETFGSWDKFKLLFNAHDEVVNRRGNKSTIWGMPQPIVPELLRRVMLRRTRNEVLPDLPSKTYTNLLVGNVDPSLQKQLDDLWEEWGDYIEIGGQLPPFERFSEIREKLARSRIPEMLEYVENSEEQEVPLVVFSDHLGPLDALLGRKGWAVITGATKPEKRQEIVRAWQAGHLKGVGISIRAGGLGLNLTHGWKALFVDLNWNPGNNWQAEDRLARIGQLSKKVEIVRMVSKHPLDLHILNLLVEKIETIQAAIDGMIFGQKIREDQIPSTIDEILEEKEKITKSEKKKIAKSKVGKIHEREKARLKKEVLPLTETRSKAVRESFSYMLSVCDGARQLDGVGFNKPDAGVAHWLLSAGLETQEELEAGYFMLQRYHRQLSQNYPILFN